MRYIKEQEFLAFVEALATKDGDKITKAMYSYGDFRHTRPQRVEVTYLLVVVVDTDLTCALANKYMAEYPKLVYDSHAWDSIKYGKKLSLLYKAMEVKYRQG